MLKVSWHFVFILLIEIMLLALIHVKHPFQITKQKIN